MKNMVASLPIFLSSGMTGVGLVSRTFRHDEVGPPSPARARLTDCGRDGGGPTRN